MCMCTYEFCCLLSRTVRDVCGMYGYCVSAMRVMQGFVLCMYSHLIPSVLLFRSGYPTYGSNTQLGAGVGAGVGFSRVRGSSAVATPAQPPLPHQTDQTAVYPSAEHSVNF